ncbi:hypothetical protein [Caulobacter phage Cr30]|uniref:hypothetical protein n=1 Tax=Caulobacter phage Cr30 TaxID=1357714 RepID=UPI0004A9B571|nr:hypothetical protein OZ74_gp172 [Caulobacter phage Cr30]AGS81171.1 hypothetical protein [Caulobacter phage Cr30]
MSAKFVATLLYADKKDGKTDEVSFEGATEAEARARAWEWVKIRNVQNQRFWIRCRFTEPSELEMA